MPGIFYERVRKKNNRIDGYIVGVVFASAKCDSWGHVYFWFAGIAGALIFALFSVSKGRRNHFNATLIIVACGVLFINDGLRIWADPMPINIKSTMCGIFFTVALVCIIAASELSRDKPTT